jgi:hypothetical protein
VVYSLFSYHQKNLGDPGSSRGTLEHIRVDLTLSRHQHLWVRMCAGPSHSAIRVDKKVNILFLFKV